MIGNAADSTVHIPLLHQSRNHDRLFVDVSERVGVSETGVSVSNPVLVRANDFVVVDPNEIVMSWLLLTDSCSRDIVLCALSLFAELLILPEKLSCECDFTKLRVAEICDLVLLNDRDATDSVRRDDSVSVRLLDDDIDQWAAALCREIESDFTSLPEIDSVTVPHRG